MRKRFRVLILAAIVAAVVVRVGFALSLQPGSLQTPSVSSGAASTSIVASTPASAPVLLAGGPFMPVSQLPRVPMLRRCSVWEPCSSGWQRPFGGAV